jgi:hypothetical protein
MKKLFGLNQKYDVYFAPLKYRAMFWDFIRFLNVLNAIEIVNIG